MPEKASLWMHCRKKWNASQEIVDFARPDALSGKSSGRKSICIVSELDFVDEPKNEVLSCPGKRERQ